MKKEKIPEPVVTRPAYRPVPMDLGFIVLGFDGDPSKIGLTLKSIEKYYSGAKTVVVVPEGIKVDFKGAKVGGTSYTSLINTGMQKPPAEWNVIVLAGVNIKEKLDHRYSVFMESRRDIFFPLIWGKYNFLDAPLNGLTIHRDTFKEVGPFAANEANLEICKMMWFFDATDKGCKFKAVAGTRMA